MRQPEEFDAFYKDARERLLVQTFALTGDLAASRRSVRDAFIVAWHRWRKLQRLEDPETVVRPHAWRLAQRRHTARVFHREKDLDADVTATLESLAKLTRQQRQALVLTQYASVTMAQMAREVGLPLEEAARELQTGASQLALLREVPTASLPVLFEGLAASVADRVRWPRAPIVRRAGAARRRTHTVVGALAMVATVGVSGAVLNEAGGARPTLDREQPAAVRSETIKPPVVALPDSALLGAAQVGDALKGTWKVRRTFDNQDGSGRVMPCQPERYADPQGVAALVRTFTDDTSKNSSTQVTQFTEASASEAAAEKTYRTTLHWFADCLASRTQLIATRRPEGVGDEAAQLVLRAWNADPVTTYVVGVARTGSVVTTAVTGTPTAKAPDAAGAAGLLARAVDQLCTVDDAGACAKSDTPTLRDVSPLAVGDEPALLDDNDLPPVTDTGRPWTSTDPTDVTANLAATRCDDEKFTGSFGGARFSHGRTRTFLIQHAGLPAKFGIVETAAALPDKQARQLVDQVHSRLASCADRMLGTTVARITDTADDAAGTSVAAWKVTVEVTDKQKVEFWMAIVRNGTSVGQVGFVPAEGVTMTTDAFVALAERARDRLGRLDPPS